MAAGKLPAEFSELEPFTDWIIETERERHLRRLATSIGDIKKFYDAMLPRMDDVMKILGRFGVDDTPPAEVRNLYLMALSFMEVSHPIELRWRGTSNTDAFLSTRLEIPNRK
jgi:hypothetical protein